MSRHSKKTPVSTVRMYRHFAVITLVITAVIAVFADGEKRDAVAATTAAPKPDPIAMAAQGKDANAIKVASRNATAGEFGGASDGGSSGGGWSGGGSSFSDDLADLAGSARGVASLGGDLPQLPGPPEGMSPEAWASLQGRHQRALQDQASADDISDLIAQSRQRSGSSGILE